MPTPTNYIFRDLHTHNQNPPLLDKLLQGSTNRTFAFTLFDRGVQANLGASAKVTAIILYDPKIVNGKLDYKGTYVLEPTDPTYNITVRESQIDVDKFSIIYVPFREEFTTFAGKCQFVLKIEENGIDVYTYAFEYMVDNNLGYFPQSIPNNLPTYSSLQKQVNDLITGKAEKDLSNVDTATFRAKAKASGVGNAESGDEIVGLLNAQPAGKKLDYNKAIDNLPTIPTANDDARWIEQAPEQSKLDYVTGLKNKPTPQTIAKDLETLSGDERLDYSALKNTPTPTDLTGTADKDLGNVNDADFLAKAKASNLMQNDMADVDLAKLSDKVFDSDAGKQIQQNTTAISGKADADMSNVDKDDFEAKLLETDSGKDIGTALTEVDKRALKDMTNVTPEDFGKLMRLTNAYKEIAKHSVVVDESFHYTEEQSSISDWTSISQKNLIIAYQFTSNDQNITQTLPPLSEGRTIVVQNILGSFTGCSLTINPASGDMINGSFAGVTVTEDHIQGIFIPELNGYEWLPYPMVHELGVAFSDDKGNIYLGEKNFKFPKTTLTMVDGEVVVTPDASQGAIPLKATDDSGREFDVTHIQSLDKKIRISNLGSGVADLDIDYTFGTEGVFAQLPFNIPINTNFHDQRPYFHAGFSNIQDYIDYDMDSKSFTIQEGDNLDPNISGGTNFKVGCWFKPLNSPIASDNGYVELKLVDPTTQQYILDISGNPVGVRREYLAGDTISEELLLAEVNAKGQIKIAFEIDCSFGDQIIVADSRSCIYIQQVDKDNITGIAEMIFSQQTGHTVHSAIRYYGANFMNFAQALTKDVGEATITNDSELMGNGMFLHTITPTKFAINNNVMNISNADSTMSVFSIGKIFDQVDTYELRDKVLNTKVTLTNKDCEMKYGLVKWTGKGLATLPILTGYTVDVPTFADGWELVADKIIPLDAVNEKHTDTNAFTVPDDAVQVAMILYPSVPQTPVTVKLSDFEIDINPTFSKVFITASSHISEFSLTKDKYVYKSSVTIPQGAKGYEYKINETATKLPIGVFTQSNNSIVNDNSWHDDGSIDPNKVQGNAKFRKDGDCEVAYTVRLRNGANKSNAVKIYFKDKDDRIIPDSVMQIPLLDDTTSIVAQTQKFRLDHVKTNDELRLYAESSIPEGAFVYSINGAYPLIDVRYDFIELTERDMDIIDKLEKGNEIQFISGGVEVYDKVLQYDVDTGKMTVIDKN